MCLCFCFNDEIPRTHLLTERSRSSRSCQERRLAMAPSYSSDPRSQPPPSGSAYPPGCSLSPFHPFPPSLNDLPFVHTDFVFPVCVFLGGADSHPRPHPTPSTALYGYYHICCYPRASGAAISAGHRERKGAAIIVGKSWRHFNFVYGSTIGGCRLLPSLPLPPLHSESGCKQGG